MVGDTRAVVDGASFSPSRFIRRGCIGGGRFTANWLRCHSNTFSSRVLLLASLAFSSSLVGCNAKEEGLAAALPEFNGFVNTFTGFGGGATFFTGLGGGDLDFDLTFTALSFLFLAEHTEHDSSEQLLSEDPDDDFLGGGEGGLPGTGRGRALGRGLATRRLEDAGLVGGGVRGRGLRRRTGLRDGE